MINEKQNKTPANNSITTAWNSIYLCTLFTFSTSFQFTMFMTSLWPFMKILDKNVAESFYGLVLALYSLSQIIASPLLGYWSNRVQSHKLPLIFCNLMLLLSNILYMVFELFPTEQHRRYALCMSRFIAGIGWAQLGLLKSYVATASLVTDRSRATAFITGGFAMGVVLGPALQALFTLVDYPGFTICVAHLHCLNISMFTVPAIFASIVNVLLMVVLVTRFQESHVGITEHEQLKKANEKGLKMATKLPPYDRCAVAVCFALRFTQFFVFTILETIGTAYAMLMFNWSPVKVVLYDSLAHAVRGVVALLVYVAYIIFDLGKMLNDRIVCLLSLVALFCFHLSTYSWPFLSNHVHLMNSSIDNTSSPLGGCDLAKYSWCARLTRISPWLYYGAIILLIGPAFPNINVAMNTLFSRIIGPRMQSTQQGLLEMHGAIGRLVGPLLISFFYTSYGVQLIWILEMCQITFMVFLWLLFYSRLVPLSIDN